MLFFGVVKETCPSTFSFYILNILLEFFLIQFYCVFGVGFGDGFLVAMFDGADNGQDQSYDNEKSDRSPYDAFGGLVFEGLAQRMKECHEF